MQELLSLRDSLQPPDIEHGTTVAGKEEVYSGADLRTGLNLVHHSDSLTSEDLFMRTLVSVFLARCLQLTQFWGELQPSLSDELWLSKLFYTLLRYRKAPKYPDDCVKKSFKFCLYFKPSNLKIMIAPAPARPTRTRCT